MIKCLNCGSLNEDDDKFCSECGQQLTTSGIGDFQQQNYNQRGQNDPRRIDEQEHTFNQPKVNTSQGIDQPRGQNDPRRIDEEKHTFNQPRTNRLPPINNNQQVNNQPQVNSQQQSTNQNTGKSGGSMLDKISNLSLPIKIIGVILLCCIGILIVGSLMGGISDKGSLSTSSDSGYNTTGNILSSFNKADCKEINYKELNKNPDKYYGDNIKLRGRIMQISEGNSGGNYLLMYVNDQYDQLAYVEYYNDTNFVEDDWVTVYGVCGGSYSYTTKIGGSNTVPSVYGSILE
ncbi:zinc ribbon domain-containing protein [Methanosphaera sp. BMS]|uniref:zinc ribbon domain-containing protein n=1 Tax=Methanosphaera sp. BMS TaxID=1789762 RepID=UPI000DC1E0D5|nr:zinc ribbon domain-containing protein [Methanosphaera sp. BMS]AWX32051.1 hypothetical protein AW729_02595 [Methanosphaera sp. BMS]